MPEELCETKLGRTRKVYHLTLPFHVVSYMHETAFHVEVF